VPSVPITVTRTGWGLCGRTLDGQLQMQSIENCKGESFAALGNRKVAVAPAARHKLHV
jgi:hypothetical protein